MKPIQSTLWAAAGFPATLAAACRGQYVRQKPWSFKHPRTDHMSVVPIDIVGRSLMGLESDLRSEIDELTSASREAITRSARRLIKSRRLKDESSAHAALERAKSLADIAEAIRRFAFAYIRATTPEFERGAPSKISLTEDGQAVFHPSDEEAVDGDLPQSSFVRQFPVFLARILAGNDDPAQTGITAELRAFPLDPDPGTAAEKAGEIADEEPVGRLDDLILRRLATLISVGLGAEIPLPTTLANLREDGPMARAKGALVESIEMAGALFWHIVGSELEEEIEQLRSVTLRDDWSIVPGEALNDPESPEGPLGSILEILLGQNGPSEIGEISPEAEARARKHLETCVNPKCLVRREIAELDARRSRPSGNDSPSANQTTEEREAPPVKSE